MNNWLYQYTEKENASPISVFIPGMQGWVNIQMPVNETYSIDRIKVKKITLLHSAEKKFDNIKHQFMVKKS